MKEHPILFSGPMVRAILEGRKTQTRRPVKVQPHEDCGAIEVGRYHPTVIDRHGDEQPGDEIFGAYSIDGDWGAKSPYGQPGDQLWVRETWGVCADKYHRVAYRADEGTASARHASDLEGGRWRPSIHMPRSACRLVLEIADVRVERLQAITGAEAIAEGVEPAFIPPDCNGDKHVEGFIQLWDDLNHARGFGWAENPWVWAIEFRRVV